MLYKKGLSLCTLFFVVTLVFLKRGSHVGILGHRDRPFWSNVTDDSRGS